VTKAQEFKSEITLKRLDQDNLKLINAKSIMGVLSAGITQGVSVEVTAIGEDQEEATDTLI